MTLKAFAIDHRLRPPRHDACGDSNLIGKRGEIYEYGKGLLAAMILHAKTPHYWNRYRQQAIAAGCKVIQNGDTEGTFTFDPVQPDQVEIAITATRLGHKRQLSDEQLQRLREAGAKYAFKPAKTVADEKTDP